MVASLSGTSLKSRALYYVRGQAPTVADYVIQEIATTLVGDLPGLPGIAARWLAYGRILRSSGPFVMERGVRLRFARNVRLGANVFIDQGVYLHACPDGIDIGSDSCVMHNAELHVFNFRDLPHAFIRIGQRSFVGESVVIRGQGGVTIGDSVLIAPQARILAVNHRFTDNTRPVLDQGVDCRGIVIEDGAWIGAGATVLDGVRIGNGAVIGANAVVTRDVPAHTVAVGIPARVIRDLNAPATNESAGTQ